MEVALDVSLGLKCTSNRGGLCACSVVGETLICTTLAGETLMYCGRRHLDDDHGLAIARQVTVALDAFKLPEGRLQEGGPRRRVTRQVHPQGGAGFELWFAC